MVWDTADVVVTDPGLRSYINLFPMYVPVSQGRHVEKQFWKSKKPIIERLMNKLMVSGHRSKKHWRTSRKFTGKKHLAYRITKTAFAHIEKKTGKNPVQVFVNALEAGSPMEGIATIEYGGVRYPKAMEISPQKRIDLALRWITQGAYAAAAATKAKKKISAALAEEIMATAQGDSTKSNCLRKKTDLERQAEASR